MKVVNFVLLLLFGLALADDLLDEEGIRQLNSTENFENCGISSNTQISTGQEVEVHSRPWMALLKFTEADLVRFLNGGTLITKRFVLSVAWRIALHDRKLIQVRLGEHHTEETEYCHKDNCEKGHIDIDVEKIITHDRVSVGHDIALIKLARDVEFNDHIRPICLPISPELREIGQSQQTFGVTGWSYNRNTGISKVLLESMALREDCNTLSKRSNPKIHICAKDRLGKICSGLFGDPLMHRVPYYGSQRFVQFGIVSLGLLRCRLKDTQIYTNIGEYIPWISRNILESNSSVENKRPGFSFERFID